MSRTVLTLMTAFLLSSTAVATAQVEWKRAVKPGSYTRWQLPAAGDSQSGAPELIFTFDDGPSEKYTPLILDELTRHNIKAIFFWVGWRVTKKSPHRAARRALVQRAIAEGHIVANHTFNHEHLCHRSLTTAHAAAQIDDTTKALEPLAGMRVMLFRTPYGDHCRRIVKLLAERNMRHLHWDIDPQEWKDKDGLRVAGTLRRKMARTGRNRSRSVVLTHDTQRATSIALPIALKWLDAENARRAKAGKPVIRVLTGSDLVDEMRDTALTAWVTQSMGAAADGLARGVSRALP